MSQSFTTTSHQYTGCHTVFKEIIDLKFIYYRPHLVEFFIECLGHQTFNTIF